MKRIGFMSYFFARIKRYMIRRIYRMTESSWKKLAKDVSERHKLLIESETRLLSKFDKANNLSLAATDVFVEKAQIALTRRARIMAITGITIGIVGVFVLVLAASYIAVTDVLFDMSEEYDKFTFTIKILKATTFSAFITGAVVLLMGMSKSLLHEAMVLYNRRHSLRFGRLYIYTQGGNVDLDKLSEAFQWNSEYASAFNSINTDGVSKSLFNKLLETPVDSVNALANILSALNKKKS